MKKILTVSLFAMMAVTAANAEIASTNYVENRTGDISTLTTTAKNNLTAAVNELNTAVTSLTSGADSVGSQITTALEDYSTTTEMNTAIGNATKDMATTANVATAKSEAITAAGTAADTKIATALEPYAKTADVTTELAKKVDKTTYDAKVAELVAADATFAKSADMTAALEKKEDVANKVTEVNESSDDAHYPSAKAVNDAIKNATGNLSGEVGELLVDYATVESVNTAVSGARTYAEEKATAAQSAAESYADGLKTTIDAAYAAADATTLQSAKNYADAEDAKIEGVIGEVAEGKTVVGLIAEAKDAAIAGATYDDTAVKASIKANADAIDAIEASDYATSGISAALVQKYNAYEQTIADNATAATNADTAINNKIGTVAMGTTATTLTGAIAEVKDNLGVLDVKIPALPAQTGMYSLVANDGVIGWEKVNPGN